MDKKELLESVKSPDKKPQRRFCYEHSEQVVCACLALSILTNS